MKKTTVFTALTIAVLIPATLYLGTHLTGRWYYLTSTLVILETMLPFFVSFESRRPQARELVLLAVMASLAVAGRVAIPIPSFKAVTGIVMLTGIAFGPQAGFLTGAIAAFASNFFFSQGPWTPWQMMAYGAGGFAAGLAFRRCSRYHTALLAAFGFVAGVLLVGPLLDCCTLFTTGSRITPKFALAVFAAGFPHNLSNAVGTAATMALFGRPLLDKLARIRRKYGMMEIQ